MAGWMLPSQRKSNGPKDELCSVVGGRGRNRPEFGGSFGPKWLTSGACINSIEFVNVVVAQWCVKSPVAQELQRAASLSSSSAI